MSAFRTRAGLALWVGALAFSLVFLAQDTSARLRSIGAISTLQLGDTPVPARDPVSPTGYMHDQHRLILPAAATDGYHWIMQTEQMLAGAGLRVRHTGVDNAPHGRAVHWSSPLRWWLGGLARAHAALRPALTPAHALEQIAAVANTLLLALFLLAVTPAVAWRFGAAAAALSAVAWVALLPLYESFMAGMLDHHGLIALSVFCGSALLVGGGAGWVRTGGTRTGTDSRAERLLRWLPEQRSARRWFIAAGVASGVGLWISAATLIPAIAATAVAALLGAAATRQGDASPDSAAWRTAPGLWRVWGVAGCVTSLVAYAIEYFPGHMGWRLEVNHPLYALAWLGAGDLVARLHPPLALADADAASASEGRAIPRTDRPWLVLDLLLILAAPALLLATGDATFRVADPLMRALHGALILEFRGATAHLASLSPLQALQSAVLLPLALLPLAALLLRTTGTSAADRVRTGVAGAMALVALVWLHVAAVSMVRPALVVAGIPPSGAGALAHVVTLCLDAAALFLLCAWPARAPRPTLDPPGVALLLTAAIPATALTALAFAQVRWLGVAAAALLALGVTAAALHAHVWIGCRPRHHRAIVTPLLVLLLAPLPLFTALFPWRLGYPGGGAVHQVVARDVAWTLRASNATTPHVVASAPTTTTWLTWFGGLRGLGTLYWENLDGLRAAAAIFGALSVEEARLLIRERRVTHLVLPSWEPVGQLPQRRAAADPHRTFAALLAAADSLPEWLQEVPYAVPDSPALRPARVRILRVLE